MSWTDKLPLEFHTQGARDLKNLMEMGYNDGALLQRISTTAGLQVGFINWAQPASLLPMQIMERAASEGRVISLLAEIVVDPSSEAIHEDIWKLLDEGTAQRVHAQAMASNPSFTRAAALADGIEYAVNQSKSSLQKIVNKLAKFNNSAMFRFQLAKREARVVRIDIDGKGEGTGWLVGEDVVLTANHVLSNAAGDLKRVTVLCDYKFVPNLNGMLLSAGRRIDLISKPLLASSKDAGVQIEFSEDGVKTQTPPLLDYALLRLSEPIGSQGLGLDGQGEEKRGWYDLPLGSYDFDPDDGFFILGHPQLQGDKEAGPQKLTLSLPCAAELTSDQTRVRYEVNSEGGNSGSPVMNQDLEPVALHHAGSKGHPKWAPKGKWDGGFNQGIPLDLIVQDIRQQVTDQDVLEKMGL